MRDLSVGCQTTYLQVLYDPDTSQYMQPACAGRGQRR